MTSTKEQMIENTSTDNECNNTIYERKMYRK